MRHILWTGSDVLLLRERIHHESLMLLTFKFWCSICLLNKMPKDADLWTTNILLLGPHQCLFACLIWCCTFVHPQQFQLLKWIHHSFSCLHPLHLVKCFANSSTSFEWRSPEIVVVAVWCILRVSSYEFRWPQISTSWLSLGHILETKDKKTLIKE